MNFFAVGFALATAATVASAANETRQFPSSEPSKHETLITVIVLPFVFHPLPLGSIKPQGWSVTQISYTSYNLNSRHAPGPDGTNGQRARRS